MPTPENPDTARRRHQSFKESHREMIETAVRLISAHGVAALSISGIAREMKIERTTVYYHFKSREALIQEVRAWATAEMTKAFAYDTAYEGRIDYTTRYVLDNPELVKLWIDDFISAGDIRESFPLWDDMVRDFAAAASAAAPSSVAGADPEVYFVNLLTSSIIGPRVFRKRVDPEADTETIVRKFRTERLRAIKAGT